MAELIDFDREYMLFAARTRPDIANLKDDALEDALNEVMLDWISKPHDALGGKTPDGYFEDYAPEALVECMLAYARNGMNVPEPLYKRLSELPECGARLADIAADENECVSARATALRIICDLGAPGAAEICVGALAAPKEIADIAADWLSNAGYAVVDMLLESYRNAGEELRDAIIDLLCYYPGVDKTTSLLRERLYEYPEKYALHASLAERLGDAELIEPLKYIAGMTEISYYDYKCIVDAIESLGGDPGRYREFYGDPDFEALRRDTETPTDIGG